jgi:hypothetical protein
MDSTRSSPSAASAAGTAGTTNAQNDDLYEDGNALAGPLSEIFTGDMTRSLTHCAGCGATGPLARLRLYDHAPGLVARCPVCGDVVLRMVRTPDAAWLDLRGTVSLDIPLAAP